MGKIGSLVGGCLVLWCGSAYGLEQGNTIELNGRVTSAPWQRNDQGQLFVQDHWVRQALGATFLSSDQPDRQRYQWYGSPAFAPALFVQPYRLLQIDPLQQGWRTERKDSTLKIFTPDTQVTEIRRNSTAKGERITIALSRPTPWQRSQRGNQLTVTVAAEVGPQNLAKLTKPTDRVPVFQVRPSGKELNLELQFNSKLIPRVSTLSNPPRLVIDLEDGYVPPPTRISWQPGITWREEWVTLNGDRFQFYALEINPKQPELSFKPLWVNQGGTAPLPTIAAPATAAINGGFFNRNRQLPVGPLKRDGTWYAGPVFQRGVIAWNDRNEFTFDRLDYREIITIDQQAPIKLTNLNSGFVQKGIARYLPTWGDYTNLTDGETIVVVQNNQITQSLTTGKALTQKVPIPADGYLLVARQVPDAASLLPIQAKVRGQVIVRPEVLNQLPHLLGAGPLLIKDGKIVTDALKEGFSKTFSNQVAPRSAIARLKNGNLLLTTIYPNPTLDQVGKLLQQLGTIDALNLDGGGSSGLWLGGAMLDREGETRPIHNAFGVFTRTNGAKSDF